MQGTVKHFNEDQGYGFIHGIDDHDYFFHISEWKEKINPSRRDEVVFEPSKNEKGLQAKNVTKNSIGRPIFIVFGSERIKLSNIKTYGLGSYYTSELKFISREDFVSNYISVVKNRNKKYREYKNKLNNSKGLKKGFIRLTKPKKEILVSDYYELADEKYNSFLEEVYEAINDEDSYYNSLTSDVQTSYLRNIAARYHVNSEGTPKYVAVKKHYLYVTTFQGDNYKFYENSKYNVSDKLVELDEYFNA